MLILLSKPRPKSSNMKTSCSTVFAGARAALALLSLAAPLAQAATYNWVPTTGGNWDTTTSNWNDGVTSPTPWINGNAASFTAFASGATITLATNITATTLSTNGGSTIAFSGTGTLDVTTITTAGTQAGGSGAIDMFAVLTGNHDFTYSSTGTNFYQGNLNLKVAANYTGDTFLTGTASLGLGAVSNTLSTGTTVNMGTGTTLRLAVAGASQQIAGLVSSNSSAGTVSTTGAGYTLKLSTKVGTTTTFSGTISSSSSTNLLYLVIDGSGTQALNGTNSFYGTTTVSGGTLRLGSHLTNNSSVTVNGGTLASSVANINLGTGGVSMSSGSINPGGTGTAGSFTLAANQNFTTTGGTLNFDIGGTFDQIIGSGSGSFSLTGTTLALSGATSVAGTYTLFSGFGGTNTVLGLTITGLDPAYTGVLGTNGVLTISLAPIPEPSTYAALAGLALLGFAALRRRHTTRR
jgi:autotransporter-associated beta strand protein